MTTLKKTKFMFRSFCFTVTDRRCTDEQWVRDLLVDGCLTYNGQYWCMCSTDLCNSGDFTSIRGMLNKRKVFSIISNFC